MTAKATNRMPSSATRSAAQHRGGYSPGFNRLDFDAFFRRERTLVGNMKAEVVKADRSNAGLKAKEAQALGTKPEFIAKQKASITTEKDHKAKVEKQERFEEALKELAAGFEFAAHHQDRV